MKLNLCRWILKTVEQKVRDCKNKTYTAHNLELIMKIAL